VRFPGLIKPDTGSSTDRIRIQLPFDDAVKWKRVTRQKRSDLLITDFLTCRLSRISRRRRVAFSAIRSVRLRARSDRMPGSRVGGEFYPKLKELLKPEQEVADHATPDGCEMCAGRMILLLRGKPGRMTLVAGTRHYSRFYDFDQIRL
jgi:hypothetical protein